MSKFISFSFYLNNHAGGQAFCCSDNSLDEIEQNKENTAENAKIEDNLYFYHPDHLGSTSMVTNYDGEVSQNVAYIPYGEVFVEERNGSWSTPYLFNAKELDEETGLYYYGARYYDPTAISWLSVDPMFEDFAGMSPYQFCHNNPVRRIDPDGNADYFSEDGAYLGSAGDAEGYRLVSKDDWKKANESAKKQYESHQKAAISNEVSKQLADKEKVLTISDKERAIDLKNNITTTAEYIKEASDQKNKEFGIDVVLNLTTNTFEYAPEGVTKGTSESNHIVPHEGCITIGNVHGHPKNGVSRSDSWTNRPGESVYDQDASRNINGVVINIETSNNKNMYHYYYDGGSLQHYTGANDAKSIIKFMVDKKAGK